MVRFLASLITGAALFIANGTVQAVEFEASGFIEPELRGFLEEASDPNQPDWNASIALQGEFEWFWNNDKSQVRFVPFARLDQNDTHRTHADVREAILIQTFDWGTVYAGVGKVFWGVTEFLHLVDIVNQTDLIENTDGEEKLGQPMLRVVKPTDWGTFEGFILPAFRERTFESRDGRPRFDIRVDPEQSRYESDRAEWHTDFAARWSHYFGPVDVAVSHFSGTGREPVFAPGANRNGKPVLVPIYPLIEQTALETQATLGAWLLKFEGFTRSELDDRYARATGGFEYTFYGLFGGSSDLGVLAEYIWDERGSAAPQPLNNEAFAGMRWTANDTQDTAVLAGLVRDLNHGGMAYVVEAERRLGSDYVLSVEGRFFGDTPPQDGLASFEDDDVIQIRLARYF